MRLVVHNHLAGASATGRRNFARTVRVRDVERERNKRAPRASAKTHDCGGEENCSCGCDGHSHDAQPADYLARVDEHLKTLTTPEAKRQFLKDQFASFETKYTDFRKRAEGNGKIGPNETANAYLDTLTELRKRLNAL